jgi:aminopeptidase S
VKLSGFAGQSVRILVEAADAGRSSVLEAAVDDLVVLRK